MTKINQKLKIGVIFGGKSQEKEVSLASGRYVYQLLDQQNFTGIPLFMDSKGGIWHLPDKLVIQNTTADITERLNEAKRIKFEELKDLIDLMFISLLGKYGEDGCIQGILEILGIPYTGSGVLASSLGMNKKVSRELLTASGFMVAKGITVNFAEFQNETWKLSFKNSLDFPCVVKPGREGSSIGVAKAENWQDLERAIRFAFNFDREVLIEEYIVGREFMCVVWGNEKPKAMLPTEVVFSGDIHTYESKYMPGRANYFTPIRVEENIVKKIQKQAVEIYKLLGMKGYGRIDGFVVREKIYISESHTGTIMIPSSYVFQQVSRVKTGTKTPLNPRIFIAEIIKMAQEAHQKKKLLL